jgi:hypothetical protein
MNKILASGFKLKTDQLSSNNSVQAIVWSPHFYFEATIYIERSDLCGLAKELRVFLGALFEQQRSVSHKLQLGPHNNSPHCAMSLQVELSGHVALEIKLVTINTVNSAGGFNLCTVRFHCEINALDEFANEMVGLCSSTREEATLLCS